ncbi:MAG: hypothetical protein ACPLXA_11720 [Moorellaceae bacterium]
MEFDRTIDVEIDCYTDRRTLETINVTCYYIPKGICTIDDRDRITPYCSLTI